MDNRYARQEVLPFIGLQGQQTLLKKKVAIIGCGALGSVASELLTRAGIGTILLYDQDIVEQSNLQRQALYTEQDIGLAKAKALKAHLDRINSTIRIVAHTTHIDSESIRTLDVDCILDGTDNMQTRDVIDQYCFEQKIPWVMASAIRDRGYVLPILPGLATYSCVFPTPTQNESCEEAGILNMTSHMIASMQVTEALKILLNRPIEQKLYSLSTLTHTIDQLVVKKNKKSRRYAPHEEKDTALYHIRICTSRKGIVVEPTRTMNLDFKKLRKKYDCETDTDLLLVFDHIYVYSYGELLFKELSDISLVEKKAIEIYTTAGIDVK